MRWKQRPEGSNWGDFGPDDQVGRLNLITPQRRRAAVREVQEGIAFMLSLPLDHPRGSGLAPARKPPRLFTTGHAHGKRLDRDHIDIGADDGVTMALQFSSQWDALSHMGALFDADADGVAEPLFYNGFRADDDVGADPDGAPRARKLGIETMAETCVQGRGVLVNLHDSIGRERVAVGYDQLMRLMEAQQVTVEPGDMLCLYTGLGDLILELGDRLTAEVIHNSCAVLDGHDKRLQRWIDESGVAALICDNMGVEAFGGGMRDEGETYLPLHHLCLFKLGIPLGELWHLAELAQWLQAHGRSRFLLTAPPLRLPGAVGSPATGVATV
jgi:kynurenine formamidase